MEIKYVYINIIAEGMTKRTLNKKASEVITRSEAENVWLYELENCKSVHSNLC